MSQKIDKKIRKEIRNKMSHEFELLKQMMIPAPKGWLTSKLWYWGLKFYFKEEIDYAPGKRYGVDLPTKDTQQPAAGVVAGGEVQKSPGQ